MLSSVVGANVSGVPELNEPPEVLELEIVTFLGSKSHCPPGTKTEPFAIKLFLEEVSTKPLPQVLQYCL